VNSKRNIKCLTAYEGTRYLGWQKTETGMSIEGELLLALQKILQEQVRLQAASRTDAGVHATGQVFNFFTARPSLDLQKLHNSFNSLLPKDIAILQCEEVSPDFHPTLHSKSKEYHYQVCFGSVQMPALRHYSWHFPHALNLKAMQAAAKQFLGTHDFSTFCNMLKEQEYAHTIRTLSRFEIIELEGQRLRIEIEGDHFLYKMVRNLVGTLMCVGCGKLAETDMRALLAKSDRTAAGITAPAHGLSLHKVFY
jgi:tRNA pseudouridine38-40 synthase